MKLSNYTGACRFFIITFICLSLSACGLIRDRSGEYAIAESGKRLSVPDGYSDLKIGSRYPIPEVLKKQKITEDDYELPRPPGITTAQSQEPYVVETVGSQTWLSLFSSPGKIWPILDFYWQENDINVSQQLIQQGYVLTSQVPQSSPLYQLVRDSGYNSIWPFAIQAKLSQGVKRNSTEIYLRIVSPGDNLLVDTWEKLEANSGLEHIILNNLGGYVSSEVEHNRESLLANDISGEPKVFLVDDEEDGKYLKLSLSYLRAWNEIGKALEASDVLLSDRDQSLGKYYVSYLSDDELDSWFMSDGARAEKRMERNLEISIVKESLGGKDVIKVRVHSLGNKFDSEVESELLSIIFEYIS